MHSVLLVYMRWILSYIIQERKFSNTIKKIYGRAGEVALEVR